jgi:outer membrane biosynthesis protein TonB
MDRRGVNFTPAFIAAILLHLAVVLASMFVWPHRPAPFNSGVTTVTIIDAPAAELRPAVAAEEASPATTEAPDPNAALEPPAPTPSPAPPQPAPAPAPAPAPTPAPKTPAKPVPVPKPAAKAPTKPAPPPPAPAKPAPAKAAAKPAPRGLDLDALTSSLTKAVKSGGGKSSAAKGANKPETATAAREGRGSADAAMADMGSAAAARLMRLWNPNCEVEGAGAINIRIQINLLPDGSLARDPVVLDRGSGPVWEAAAQRAKSAAAAAAPYKEFPRSRYNEWKVFTPRFVGEQACRGH